MKSFSILLLFVCLCCADKEYEEEFASLFDNKLLHELEKRLLDYDDAGNSRRGESGSQCEFSYQDNLIIKTKLSLDQGAVFIDSPEIDEDEIHPRKACQEKCCKTEDCNLAVYKEKIEHACYLFNCGEPSKCNFSVHDGFTSMGLTGGLKRDHMKTASKNQHAQDLADLAVKTTTTTITTTTTTTKAPTKPPKKSPVSLFGTCDNDKECAGSGTECLAGYCVCIDGYHPQDGICRESCTRFQFECKNDGQPLLSPQCIAIYDTCDGVDHCQDGSDEQSCASGTKGFKGDNGRPRTNQGNLNKNQQTLGTSDAEKNVKEGGPVSGLEPIKQQSNTNIKVEQQTVDQSPNIPKPAETSAVEGSDQEKIEQSQNPSAIAENQDTDKQENKGATDDKVPNSESADTSETADEKSGDSNSDEATSKPKKPDISVAKVQAGGDASLGIEEAALEETVESNKFSNQTAVIVLALGLGITAVLLIFVGCRLRNVKRRLRKGRPMNSNEADYLINGMYL